MNNDTCKCVIGSLAFFSRPSLSPAQPVNTDIFPAVVSLPPKGEKRPTQLYLAKIAQPK